MYCPRNHNLGSVGPKSTRVYCCECHSTYEVSALTEDSWEAGVLPAGRQIPPPDPKLYVQLGGNPPALSTKLPAVLPPVLKVRGTHIGYKLQTWVSDELLLKLDGFCKANKLPRSEVVRVAIAALLHKES